MLLYLGEDNQQSNHREQETMAMHTIGSSFLDLELIFHWLNSPCEFTTVLVLAFRFTVGSHLSLAGVTAIFVYAPASSKAETGCSPRLTL